jgi:formylglycine-generating enzyme required for sulfatase activity/tRNA A-37 threonylcarbamoyl transferase component Bud32
MPPPALAHPSDELLAALASGRLDEATAETVIAHLETCPVCTARASSVPPDSLLRRLRDAHAPADAPPPAGPPRAEAPAETPPDVPAELREHPQYEVVRELGRGGMGVVYLARHKLTDRAEVLKVIKTDRADPEAAARFLREIRSAARLDHPNVVRAYGAFEASGLVVFVMEYVEGENLDRVVRARGRLPVAEAGRHARQAALGLQHAHEKRLIHRDIKPQNLILDRGGVVKVLDFGLAKATSEQGTAGHVLTRSGDMFGTPSFMAPEQARDAARADIRADLYSLGCTLYYLLAGRPPFEANSLYGLLHAHQVLEATPLDQVRADVPAALAAVVGRLMAKDPADRYQTPAEAAAALAPFAEPGVPAAPAAPPPVAVPSASTVGNKSTITRPPEKAPAWQAPPPAAPWSGRWLVVAGVGLLLMAGAVGLWASGVFRVRTPDGIAADKGRSAKTTRMAKAPVPPRIQPDGPPKSRAEQKVVKPRPAEGMAEAKQKPLLLKAPFSEEVAKELQRAWATYLGKQVEEEVDLGGGVTMQFVLIPPGTFTMGSPKEEEGRFNDEMAHEVTITRPFYLGKYVVTQEQYQQLTGSNPSTFGAGGGRKDKVAGLDTARFPVDSVSWEDATACCAKLAEKAGRKARLPSEAEWEYACRAGTTSPFHFGTALNGSQANCKGTFPYGTQAKGPFLDRTCRVGSYRPNAWGLYDMHGNVCQWCQDWYAKSCQDLGGRDPVRVDKGADNARVVRGGSWPAPATVCRAACRHTALPANRSFSILGFRVALLPPDVPTKISGRKKDHEPSPGPGAGNAGTGQRPPLAHAPFDGQRAKELQRAWAKYLGRKVEEELDLGGGVKMQFVLIPPGTFTMGASKAEIDQILVENKAARRDWFDGEQPHEVTITRPFYLGKYPVTQEQFEKVMGFNPSYFSARAAGRKGKAYDLVSKPGGGRDRVRGLGGTDDFPVENVSWDEAVEFCRKLPALPGEQRAGRSYRLPSEAEWEYACRVGTTTPFHFGTALNGTQANCNGNVPYGTREKGPFLDRTCRVGSYRPNAFGLYDMHGNVWQWCQDWYARSCDDLPRRDPVRVEKGFAYGRVVHGGSWFHDSWRCRAACRNEGAPADPHNAAGFRVAFRLD